MHRRLRGKRRLLIPLMLFIALLGTIQIATAHPLGNFTISHYRELTFEQDRVTLYYALDLAFDSASIRYRDGEAELNTTLIEAARLGTLPENWQASGTGSYTDTDYDSRLGLARDRREWRGGHRRSHQRCAKRQHHRGV